jgi:hypothetical protein
MRTYYIRTGCLCISIVLSKLVFAGLVDPSASQSARFRVSNQCPYTIWIQQDYNHKTSDPVVVQIPTGKAYDYSIPDKGLPSTRFWPKRDCNQFGYKCRVGESVSVPAAEAAGQQKPPYHPDINSKFEATWGCSPELYKQNPGACAQNPSATGKTIDSQTWWNGSAVDGYTLPYFVHVYNHNQSCMDMHSHQVIPNPNVDCSRLSVDACPTDENLSTEGKFNLINGIDVTHVNLQWVDSKSGEALGCFSPCTKLATAQGSDNGSTLGGWSSRLGGLTPQSKQAQMYCCPTPPVSPEACMAGPAARTSFSQSVHGAQQCNSYTYAYDDAMGLAQCSGSTQFEIVFCPKPGSDNPNPTVPQTQMKVLLPVTGVQINLDDKALSNNQSVTVKDDSELSQNIKNNPKCTLKVTKENLTVSTKDGELCDTVVINNTSKTMSVGGINPSLNATLQFNLNPNVGIVATINGQPIVNGKQIKASTLTATPLLKATQANKSATCQLTIKENQVARGTGEFCNRLNIVSITNLVQIYLPADIPAMGPNTDPVPNPDPNGGDNNPPVPGNGKAISLGIAAGMKVALTAANGTTQTVSWNSTNKQVTFLPGATNLTISGAAGNRQCAVSYNGTTLTWPQTAGCSGIVVNGATMYFPAF